MELLAAILIELDKLFILEHGKVYLNSNHKAAIENAAQILDIEINSDNRRILNVGF